MEVSVAEPQLWEQLPCKGIPILSFFSFFPFPNRFGDILVSNLNMGNKLSNKAHVGVVWFHSHVLQHLPVIVYLHNKSRVVLKQQIYDDETYAKTGLKIGPPLIQL
jgi:hypothetical protein